MKLSSSHFMAFNEIFTVAGLGIVFFLSNISQIALCYSLKDAD